MCDYGWTIVATGVVFTGEQVIWYCITCYSTGDETLPLAA